LAKLIALFPAPDLKPESKSGLAVKVGEKSRLCGHWPGEGSWEEASHSSFRNEQARSRNSLQVVHVEGDSTGQD
jgi:hypothetical protein